MGNMLPACLIHQGATAALPAMKSRQSLVSLNLLVKAVQKLKKRPGSKEAKIDSNRRWQLMRRWLLLTEVDEESLLR